MSGFKNISTVYIMLWICYNLEGWAYSSGGSIGRILMLLILSLSVYYFIIVNTTYKLPPLLKGVNLLVFMYTIYGVLLLISGKTFYIRAVGAVATNYTYLQYMYMSYLPVYAFFHFSKRGYLTEDVLRKWVPIFCCVAVIVFFIDQQKAVDALFLKGVDSEDVTNNAGYVFLSLIPASALFYKKPLLQFLVLSFCLVFILLCVKRGAIIIAIICLLFYLYHLRGLLKSTISSKAFTIFLFTCFIVGAIIFIRYMMQSNVYFMNRIIETQEGNSSGRDVIYSRIIEYLRNNNNIIFLLFGRGAFGTLEVTDNFAHNDWLEIAVNQGLLGISIFSYYWIQFYKTWKSYNTKSYLYVILGCAFICCFTQTLFSMTSITLFLSCVLGYALTKMAS